MLTKKKSNIFKYYALLVTFFVIGSLGEASSLQSGLHSCKSLFKFSKQEHQTYVSFAVLPMSARLSAGESFNDVFRETKLPWSMRRFYDKATGHFKYKKNISTELASENGDAKLFAIRINAEPSKKRKAGMTQRFELLFKEYIGALSFFPGVELWVAANAQQAYVLEKLIDKHPKYIQSKIKIIKTNLKSFDIWAQDSSKPTSALGHTLVQRKANNEDHPQNRRLTRALGLDGVAKFSSSPFRFEGGNIIVGDKHVFIGPDIVRSAIVDFKISREEALNALSVEFGKPVIEIGSKGSNGALKQVDFHIDLSFSIVRDHKSGKEVALVSSPLYLLKTVLKLPDVEKLDSTVFRYVIDGFISRLNKKVMTSEEAPPTPNERNFLRVLQKMDFNDILKEEAQLTQIQKILENNGYKVIRIPGRVRHREKSSIQIFNYTNIILSGTKAIVPRYDIKSLDNEFYSIIKKLGYKIFPMKSIQRLICKSGGIRCASETYRRPIYFEDSQGAVDFSRRLKFKTNFEIFLKTTEKVAFAEAC